MCVVWKCWVESVLFDTNKQSLIESRKYLVLLGNVNFLRTNLRLKQLKNHFFYLGVKKLKSVRGSWHSQDSIEFCAASWEIHFLERCGENLSEKWKNKLCFLRTLYLTLARKLNYLFNLLSLELVNKAKKIHVVLVPESRFVKNWLNGSRVMIGHPNRQTDESRILLYSYAS